MQTEERSAADSIDSLLSSLKGVPPDKRLTIVGAIIETLRLLSEAVPVTARASAKTAALATMADLSSLPVEKIGFSVLRTIKAEELSSPFAEWAEDVDTPNNRAQVRLNALKLFMNVLEIDADAADEALLAELVKEEAVNFRKPQPKAERTTSAPRFEINQPLTVLRAFRPRPFVYDDKDPARLSLVEYKGELAGGGLGPSMWGICYDDEEVGSAHVLLETGEYVVTPSNSLTLARVTATADVPPYLLACAHLFMPLVLSKFNKLPHDAEGIVAVQDRFGSFTQPLYFHQATPQSVFSLTGVIESAKWQFGGTAPSGAMAKFPVPELASIGAYVMVVASTNAVRPYICANLIAKTGEKEEVVMRLDRPREFSALGVYLFPLQDSAVALVVPPA